MGGNSGTDLVGGTGGGLIRIQASDNVTLNGLLTANAQDGWSSGSSRFGGGGSGGGIFITCARFTGTATGLMKADGGAGLTNIVNGTGAGGGGGGRIAIWQGVPQSIMTQYIANGVYPGIIRSNALDGYAGALSVSGGTGYTNLPPVGAEAGTQWFFTYAPSDSGTIFTLR